VVVGPAATLRLADYGAEIIMRNPIHPDVPSIDEAGVPGYETVNWFGLVAPAGTPAAIILPLSLWCDGGTTNHSNPNDRYRCGGRAMLRRQFGGLLVSTGLVPVS
jgi:hypothetical protein